jgi:hypothetical protein
MHLFLYYSYISLLLFEYLFIVQCTTCCLDPPWTKIRKRGRTSNLWVRAKIEDWWLQAKQATPKQLRKGLETMTLLTVWMI